jgi:hypothetical protein
LADFIRSDAANATFTVHKLRGNNSVLEGGAATSPSSPDGTESFSSMLESRVAPAHYEGFDRSRQDAHQAPHQNPLATIPMATDERRMHNQSECAGIITA